MWRGLYVEGLIFGILRYLLAASFHLLLSCTPIIIKLGFSGILHSTMVKLFFKTFKCGRVDLLSRQKETVFRKQKRMCDTCDKFSFVTCLAKCKMLLCSQYPRKFTKTAISCHILYTTNTCTAELELLTFQAFLPCVSFTLATRTNEPGE